MKRLRSYSALGICAAAALLAGCGGSHAQGTLPATMQAPNSDAQRAGANEQVLYSFSAGNDGGNAATGLSLDAHGNLYGTTVIGGTFGCGTVFELAPQASPPWPETVLYNFDCYSTGKSPHGGVTLDRMGNLYGTTVAGGSGGSCASDGCGVAFQLTPSGENVLHSFTAGKDGFGPGGGVTFDPAGRFYGTTPDGGTYSEGVVYAVTRAGAKWSERVVHAFTGGSDGGVGSLGPLLRGKSGNLYGVTELGGANGAGTVFELSTKGRGKLTPLYAFKGAPDAAFPYGGLVADGSGNLYGTTYYGGANGVGSVFELAPSGSGYRESVLYSFVGGSDGSSPTSTLVLAKSGVLYGTTSAGGGTCGCGTIFSVNARSGKERVLHRFSGGTDGAYAYYGLTQGANGTFYGSTVAGGRFNQGTVFAFTATHS